MLGYEYENVYDGSVQELYSLAVRLYKAESTAGSSVVSCATATNITAIHAGSAQNDRLDLSNILASENYVKKRIVRNEDEVEPSK